MTEVRVCASAWRGVREDEEGRVGERARGMKWEKGKGMRGR